MPEHFHRGVLLPLAITSYTNMLMDVPTMSRMTAKVITPDSISWSTTRPPGRRRPRPFNESPAETRI